MNKIEIVNSKIISNIDDTISLTLEENTNFLAVKKLTVDVINDTDLILEIKNNELEKWNIVFNINQNANLNLFELKEGSETKTQYIYNLNEFSKIFVYKFNDVEAIKERTIINLNGFNSKIDYNFKTISKDIEEYDYIINHNACNTESNLNTSGINIKNGMLSFNITGDVIKGKTDCIINEESRIINLTDNKCIIKPNLLVEEYSVSANHSALIGNFSDEELFYLQSRGITKENAMNLLIRGFLIKNISIFESQKEKVEEIINKYWR